MRIPGILTDLATQLLNEFEGKVQQALSQPQIVPAGQIVPVTLPMPVLELAWVENIKKELGVAELPYPANNPRIIWYDTFTTLRATYESVSWCSAFMNAMLITSGIEGTRSAAALDWINQKWGIELKYAVHGCLAIWDWGNGHGHVACVMEANEQGLIVIGGNQRDKGVDKVCQKMFPWSLPPVSFKWPKDVPLPAGAEVDNS